MNEEKRRASRSGLLVEVRYEGAGVTAQTRISDISETGVFVETMLPPPVGSVVGLFFTLPGGHVIQTDGVVKQLQPGIGMGVEFSNLNPRDAEFIRTLGGASS